MRRLPALVMVLGLFLGAAFALPEAALSSPAHTLAGACSDTAYPPSPHATIMSSTTTPNVGQTIEASGTRYCPDEDVALTIDGTAVGTAHTDAHGAFDPHVVVNKAGSHLQLCGIGASGLADDQDCLTLSTPTATSSESTGGSTSHSGTSLTGTDILALCLLAAALIGGGAVLMVTSRRRLATKQS